MTREHLRELAGRWRAGGDRYWSDVGTELLDALDLTDQAEKGFAAPDIDPILNIVDPDDHLFRDQALAEVKGALEVARDALKRAGLEELAETEGLAAALRAFLS